MNLGIGLEIGAVGGRDGRQVLCVVDRLYLTSVQNASLLADGHILYADAAGLAVRRQYAEDSGLFDPAVVRGEDTLLLARLCSEGHAPRLLPTHA